MSRISFVIPCFNCADTLAATVKSIMYSNFEVGDEIIMVDDGSTDSSLSVIESFCVNREDIKCIRLLENKGNEYARNIGVRNAQNELIFNLDSDNILMNSTINNLRDIMNRRDVDACSFRNLFYFRRDPRRVEHIWKFNAGLVHHADCLAGGVNPISSGNYLFKKDVWSALRGYKEGAKALDAWFFGFETVFNDFKLHVSDTAGYFHRFGHNSLWLRDAKRHLISDISRNLVLKYKSMLSEEAIQYLENPTLSKFWFENMDSKPLKLVNGETGKNGEIIKKTPFMYNTHLVPFL